MCHFTFYGPRVHKYVINVYNDKFIQVFMEDQIHQNSEHLKEQSQPKRHD